MADNQQALSFLDKFENPGHLTAVDRIERNEVEAAGIAKSPMTADDEAVLMALRDCRFGYGWNNAHRFVRDMTAVSNSDRPEITDNQRRYLWKLVHRFRKQIDNQELQDMAEERV